MCTPNSAKAPGEVAARRDQPRRPVSTIRAGSGRDSCEEDRNYRDFCVGPTVLRIWLGKLREKVIATVAAGGDLPMDVNAFLTA